MSKLLPITLLLLLAACAGHHSADEAASGVGQPAHREIRTLWSVDVDQRRPMDPMAFSQPVVANGSRIVVGGRDGRVHIYNMNGREQQRVAVNDAVDSGGLALADGSVVVGDVSGMLYGIDVASASVRWRHQLSSPLIGRPVAAGGDCIVQTQDNRLYRIDASGKKLWSYAGQAGGLSLYLNSSPLLFDGVVYAVFSNGDAVALRAENGELVWRRQLLLSADAPVLRELRTPAADPIRLAHLSMGTESVDDVLVIGFYQGDLLSLSRQDGSQLFSQPMSIKSSPLEIGNTLYIATADGALRALDVGSGATLWQKQLAGELVGPVLNNGSLWLANDLGQVFRLSPDGLEMASTALQGRIDRLPLAAGRGVLVRTDRGAMYLLQ